jgi:hypothetical protein
MPNTTKSLSNDVRLWMGDQIITDPVDYKKTLEVIAKHFRIISEFFHCICAQEDSFPSLRFKQIKSVMMALSKLPFDKSLIVSALKAGKDRYKELRPVVNSRF